MPWKTNDEEEARRRFIEERVALGETANMTALCRRHEISRECGYKWWRRFKAGGRQALRARSRATRRASAVAQIWLVRLLEAKHRHRRFGPKKLRWQLRQDYPRC